MNDVMINPPPASAVYTSILIDATSIPVSAVTSSLSAVDTNSSVKLPTSVVDSTSLENYAQSLPFVQRILNSNHSDRLKISASQLLFRNVLDLDRGIFLPAAERLLAESKPLSRHMTKMLQMQDSLLKASAAKLLRTDFLHVSTKL